MISIYNSEYLAAYRPHQIKLFKTLELFCSKGIPIEDAFYQGVSEAHAKIMKDEEYEPCTDTAGLHHTLSKRSWYNPYQDAYHTIVSEDRNGWEQYVGLHNVYSSTGYRMFRLDGVFYLVYVNATNAINKVEGDWWHSEFAMPTLPSLPTESAVAPGDNPPA
jgi:hypothetical protein